MTTTRWLLLAQLFQSESPEAEDNRGKIVKSELIGIYPGNMESSQRVITLKKYLVMSLNIISDCVSVIPYVLPPHLWS